MVVLETYSEARAGPSSSGNDLSTSFGILNVEWYFIASLY
jgi:hypothetical protein